MSNQKLIKIVLDEAKKAHPGDEEYCESCLMNIANIYWKQGFYTKAISTLKDISYSQEADDIRLGILKELLTKNRSDDAIKIVKKITDEKNKSQAWAYIAIDYGKKNDSAEFNNYLEKAVEIYVNNNNENDKSFYGIGNVIKILSENGYRANAEKILNLIEKDTLKSVDTKFDTDIKMVHIYNINSKSNEASTILMKSFKKLSSENMINDSILEKYALAYLNINCHKKALRLMNKIYDEKVKSHTKGEMVLLLLAKNKISSAVKIAQSISIIDSKVEALKNIEFIKESERFKKDSEPTNYLNFMYSEFHYKYLSKIDDVLELSSL